MGLALGSAELIGPVALLGRGLSRMDGMLSGDELIRGIR
jgi:hypothetical protein